MQNLISIYIENGVSGRIFCYPNALINISYEDLALKFSRKFVDDDDNLDGRRQAIKDGLHYLETFYDEDSPFVQHAYLKSDTNSAFMCVLGTIDSVKDLLQHEKFIFETCNFQVVGSKFTQNSIMTGLEEWKRRVWPDVDLPKLTYL